MVQVVPSNNTSTVRALSSNSASDVPIMQPSTILEYSRDWAIKTDGLVQGIDYSSKYYAGVSQEAANSILQDTGFIAVSESITNINAVAGDLTNINAVAEDITEIDIVAGVAANVTSVASNVTSINTCAANIGNINICAANVSVIGDKVSKTGDTMTGGLTVASAAPFFICQGTTIDKTSTTAPANDLVSGIFQTQDKNGQFVSNYSTAHTTYNNFVSGITLQRTIGGVNANANLMIGVDTEGKDFANFSSGIKQNITNWAFPSTVTAPITVGASGATYTATANGYVQITATQDQTDGFVFLTNTSNGIATLGQPPTKSSFSIKCYIPVAKWQSYQIDYGGVVINSATFISAIGG